MSTIALRPTPGRRLRPAGSAAGLLVVALLVAGGFALNRVVPAASTLLWAMGLGVLAAPLVGRWPRAGSASVTAGVRCAATHLLRTGVALLGLRISAAELADVGVGGAMVAAGTILVTLVATRRLGRRLRVPDGLTLLIAAGSAICGASAIAAVSSVTRARQEDVGYAVATVTVFGTAAMLLVPVASSLLGLDDAQAGMWAGASIHEVAQATAAGGAISVAALKVATLVKLGRVVLLAPVISVLGRRAGPRTGEAAPAASASGRAGAGRSGVVLGVPGFVLAFLALVALRSVAPVPGALLVAASVVSTMLLAAGLAALGLGIRVGALRAAGLRPLVLGVAAWAVAAVTALALVLLVGS